MQPVAHRYRTPPPPVATEHVAPALQRVVDASQRALVEQFEVLRVDVQLQTRRVAVSAALSAVAAFLLLAAWALLVAAVLAGFEAVPWATRLALAGAAHALLACLVGAILAGRRRR